MSFSGSIDIHVNNKLSISITDLVKYFLSRGWSLDDYGKITYIPLREEDFEWHTLPLNEEGKVFNVLENKYESGEIVGIVLTWENTDIGISCLFYPYFSRITFSIMINRRTLKGLETTDFSWYLERIVPILIEKGLSIEMLDCEDSY